MKKLYILLVIALIGFVGNAQIVNIPDANFKTRLLQADVTNQIARDVNFHFIKIDINGDGEIQSTEAEEVYTINLSYAFINDLTGINSFVNLAYLDCSHNELTTLNVSGLTNLISLVCLLNQLPTLDLTGLNNLTTLDCSSNQLPNLDITGLTNLNDLRCSSNQLTTLDVTVATNLTHLNCSYNQLSTLNVNGIAHLVTLICNNNQLTTLNLNGLTGMFFLLCNNNQLTTLDVSFMSFLTNLTCSNNQLITMYIKNGSNESDLLFANNPNLQYICADASQIENVQNKIIQYGYVGCTVDSSCSLSNEVFELNDFSLFPNPTKDILNFDIKTETAVNGIAIYNMLEQMVIAIPNAESVSTIDVSYLKTGTYFIKVNTDKGTANAKFIKE